MKLTIRHRDDSIYCPCCGYENPELIIESVGSHTALGCSECLIIKDAEDWAQEREEERICTN